MGAPFLPKSIVLAKYNILLFFSVLFVGILAGSFAHGNRIGDIEYTTWTKTGQRTWKLDQGYRWKETDYTIGYFVSGRYKGYDLLLRKYISEWECKGAGCEKILTDRARFARKGKTIVYLPRISEIGSHVRGGTEYICGWTEKRRYNNIDESYTIPELEYKKILTGSNARETLIYESEEEGHLDSSKLVQTFVTRTSGAVYMTIPDLNPLISFYWDESPVAAEDCVESQCFMTNAFFLFRPDGTYHLYRYEPDIILKLQLWDGIGNLAINLTAGFSRTITANYRTHAYCGDDEYSDYGCVLSSKYVRTEDLIPIGTIKIQKGPAMGKADPVFKVSGQHPVNTQFYADYSMRWLEVAEHMYHAPKKPVNYEEFLDRIPVLIWKDPFGRLIRLNRNEFIPPSMCEPIIYVYSPQNQEVSIRVKGLGRMFASTPKHNEGWRIYANDAGAITDTASGRHYDYLFWEGSSLVVPEKEEGFVLARDEIPQFLSEILPKLGLQGREINDFIKTWAIKLQAAPYCFITFHNAMTIRSLAELEVNPHPDTVIRVLMDYRLLASRIHVHPPTLEEPNKRKGLTIVEWGGIER